MTTRKRKTKRPAEVAAPIPPSSAGDIERAVAAIRSASRDHVEAIAVAASEYLATCEQPSIDSSARAAFVRLVLAVQGATWITCDVARRHTRPEAQR